MKVYRILFLILVCVFATAACHQKIDQQLVTLNERIFENLDSVVVVLNELQPDYEDMSEEEKALFDLCLFMAASLQSDNFPPIADIDRSITYFEQQGNARYASEGYYSKALYHKEYRNLEQANTSLLKARDLAQKIGYTQLLARIYFNLGHIAGMQNKYEVGYEYLNKSVELFQQNNDKKREAIAYDVASMAALAQDSFELSREYSFKALNITSDSVTIGDIYSNIGVSHYFEESFDSAYYYLHLSLDYPVYSSNLSLRYYHLATLFANNREYDSADYYVHKAFENPVDIYIEEELYRIATDVALHKGNKEEVSEYIRLRAQCNDSIIILEQQPNITIVDQIHQATLTNERHESRQKYLIFIIIALVIVAILLYIVLQKKRRTKKRIAESLELHKEALQQHQKVLKTISVKIREEQDRKIYAFKNELDSLILASQSNGNSKLSFAEKEHAKRNAYFEFLNIENEEVFKANMNVALSSYPDKLSRQFADISYKDIIWCCLFVLNIPTTDIALIFSYTQNSLYKFKQRLCKKLHFSSTKEFEQFLRELLYIEA